MDELQEIANAATFALAHPLTEAVGSTFLGSGESLSFGRSKDAFVKNNDKTQSRYAIGTMLTETLN